MTDLAAMTQTLDVDELQKAIQLFSTISDNLSAGYKVLHERAARVEHELMLANQRLEAILEAIPTGVVVRDASGEVSRLNRAAKEILGLPAGTDPEALLDALPEDSGPRRTCEFNRPDGSARALRRSRSTVTDLTGEFLGTVELLDDCTERNALTNRVHAMDKLAALGTMAAGIAHEIRNPLNAVQGFASLLLKDIEKGGEAERWASQIVAGSEEANEIIRGMLSFAKPDQLVPETVRAEYLLESAMQSVRHDEQADFPWTVELETAPITFAGDRLKLRHALRNLITNAMDAQPAGGHIHVALSEEGSDIRIRVHDAGPGIPDTVRNQILDPFFTTRAEGTGLGLALTQTIAQLHGGSVSIAPEPGPLGGADISIRFPKTPVNS